MKNDLYILNGGIGKNICFSSCLNGSNKINIMSPWPKLFSNHPNVNYSYEYSLIPWKDETLFFNSFDNIHLVDGYDSYFYRNKIHLIKNFRRIMGQGMDNQEIYNEIYFTKKEEDDLVPLVSQLKDFVLVQFVGSEETFENTDFEGSRALGRPQAQELIDILNFDLKLNVLNVFSSLDLFNNTCKIDQKLDYMIYAHLLKHAKGFISIDSCLNHMSANKFCKTKGVVLWNNTNVKERFSYNKNINITTNTPNVMRFNVEEIIDNFLKIYKGEVND